MQPQINKGILVTGGTFSGGTITVGDRATVNTVQEPADQSPQTRALEEARAKLDELMQALRANSGTLADEADVIGATETVGQELARDKPNRLTMSAILASIAGSVSSVAGVATAVEALKAAVSALI